MWNNKERTAGRVVFYAVRVVSKENWRLTLAGTSCWKPGRTVFHSVYRIHLFWITMHRNQLNFHEPPHKFSRFTSYKKIIWAAFLESLYFDTSILTSIITIYELAYYPNRIFDVTNSRQQNPA
jgi:hypothetical protein